MDYEQGPTWDRHEVDSALGKVPDGMRRTANVLARTGNPEGRGDVQVTVIGNGRRLLLGGFEDDARARVWAHVVARVEVADISSVAETHQSAAEPDIALHRDLTASPDLAGVIHGIWTRIGGDLIVRPEGAEYELVMARGGTDRNAGRLTADRAEDIRSTVLALSKAKAGSTDTAFDADGCTVRVSIAKSGSGFRMTLRPIRVDRH